MKPILILITFALIAISCASCNIPGAANAPQAWIDAPLNSSVLPMNEKVDVISHSNDLSGISKVELDINNSTLSTDSVPEAGQVYVLMKQAWTPTEPGTYQVRVRAQSGSGHWSDYAVVNVTVEAGPTNTPAPVVSPTLVVTLPPSITPTPASPTFTLNENAFCRKGPDTSFPDITAIPKGDTVDIQGVSEDGFWYFVFWKQFDAKCWVAAPAGQASGALQGIPVLVSPDTPTPPPVPEPTGYKP